MVPATKLGPTLPPGVLVTVDKGDTVIDLCLVQIVGDVDLKESKAKTPIERGKRNWIVKPCSPKPHAL